MNPLLVSLPQRTKLTQRRFIPEKLIVAQIIKDLPPFFNLRVIRLEAITATRSD
jgi:hypothetical protein